MMRLVRKESGVLLMMASVTAGAWPASLAPSLGRMVWLSSFSQVWPPRPLGAFGRRASRRIEIDGPVADIDAVDANLPRQITCAAARWPL